MAKNGSEWDDIPILGGVVRPDWVPVMRWTWGALAALGASHPMAQRVVCVLVSLAREDNAVTIGQGQLLDRVGCSSVSLWRALKYLEVNGWVRHEPVKQSRVLRYIVNDRVAWCDRRRRVGQGRVLFSGPLLVDGEIFDDVKISPRAAEAGDG